MLFNPAEFLGHVDDLDMSEDRKLDMIRVVAAIMQSYVDRARKRAPEQILLGIVHENSGAERGGEVDSASIITSTFNGASGETFAGKSPP